MIALIGMIVIMTAISHNHQLSWWFISALQKGRLLRGAGALVTQNVQIPDDSMVYGSPAKVVRQVRPQELEASRENAREYVQLAREQLHSITRPDNV